MNSWGALAPKSPGRALPGLAHREYRVSEDRTLLNGHCTIDIKTMILANLSFNGGHDQIHFKIYLTEIGDSSKITRDFLEKATLRDRNRRKTTTEFFLIFLSCSNVEFIHERTRW